MQKEGFLSPFININLTFSWKECSKDKEMEYTILGPHGKKNRILQKQKGAPVCNSKVNENLIFK
jgi:hypothetical protein